MLVSRSQYSKPRVIPANLYGYETPLTSLFFLILNKLEALQNEVSKWKRCIFVIALEK